MMMITKRLAAFSALAALISVVVSGQQQQQQHRNNIEYKPTRCKKGWRAARRHFRHAAAAWPSPYCYTFTFEQFGFHPDPAGPVDVTVVDGVVVSPVDANDVPLVPSIEEIFETIYDQCFAKCPGSGPNKCVVTYSNDSSIARYPTSVFIDPSKWIADEEISYAISDVLECEL